MAKLSVGCLTVIRYSAQPETYALVEETEPHKLGQFNLPGGGVDPEESIITCAIRETLEETGLDEVELIGFLGLYNDVEARKIQIAFAARALTGRLTPSPEHPRVEAFTLADIAQFEEQGRLRSQRVVELIEQSRRGMILPLDYVHVIEPGVLATVGQESPAA